MGFTANFKMVYRTVLSEHFSLLKSEVHIHLTDNKYSFQIIHLFSIQLSTWQLFIQLCNGIYIFETDTGQSNE